ncbi:hypothetical protein [Acetobacterium wieringae]|uniref:hypothetical protein n=1 Tax=Acetobacterium wieringae TaxID=52694 RepID=UPI0026F173B0|nr:hypothetical protein [Acetobacterium wieringae]
MTCTPKKYWIPGRPATFATNSEIEWKNTIKEYIGSENNQYNSLEFEFRITPDNMSKYAFDIDNLCEPVFAVLASKLGWYEKKRKNIVSWKAVKKENENPGLILKDVVSTGFERCGEKPIFVGIYQGEFPKKATDHRIPEWLASFDNRACVNERCSMRLEFGPTNLSIATIASGTVKPIIDCMYPVIGGNSGVPDDHKITELLVEKSVEDLLKNQVRITIWEIN